MNEHFEVKHIVELSTRGRGSARTNVSLLVLDRHNTIHLLKGVATKRESFSFASMMQEGKVGGVKYHGERQRIYRDKIPTLRKTVHAIDEVKNRYMLEEIDHDDVKEQLFVSKSYDPNDSKRLEHLDAIKNDPDPRHLPSHLSELVLSWDGNLVDDVFEVLDDRFSTPLLEEWKETLYEELEAQNYIETLSVYSFLHETTLKAALIRATTQHLEKVVTELVQAMELNFAIEDDGRSEREGKLKDIDSIEDYLMTFSNELGRAILDTIDVRFNPSQHEFHPSFRHTNLHANEKGITGLYAPQATVAMGVANTLKEDNFVIINGEMGTGKTPIAMASTYVAEAVRKNKDKPDPYRSIVLSPAIMVDKWKRELKERIPDCEVYQIESFKDAQALRNLPKKPEKIEFYLLNSNLLKTTIPQQPHEDWRYHKSDVQQVKENDPVRFVTRSRRLFDENNAPIVKGTNEDGVPNEKAIEFVKEEVEIKKNQYVRPIYDQVRDPMTGELQNAYQTGDTGYYCPKCGNPIQKGRNVVGEKFFKTYTKSTPKYNKKAENSSCTAFVSTRHMPKEDIEEWMFDKETQRWVPDQAYQTCNYSFWGPQHLKKDSGHRKVSPAWFINKFLPRGFFTYLIADEVHEYKSGESNVGKGFGQLVNHTEKQILLTGTLNGGMSKDIFFILARLMGKKMKKEGIGFDDLNLFNARYGVSEFKIRENKRSSIQKPGISPALYPMYLMENTIFLDLSDIGYALPKYEEVPVIVQMSEPHRQAYDRMARQIRSASGLNGLSKVSLYHNLMTQYADCPQNFPEVIRVRNDEGTLINVATPNNLLDYEDQKFDALVAQCDTEIQNDRKNLIYVSNTGDNSYNEMDVMIYNRFKSLGYNVGIMKRSGTIDGIRMPKKPEERENWLKEKMDEHDWDILIVNPTLVKVGLDLLMFQNIHFYQLPMSSYDFMQSSRRSWRIRQTEEVRVYTYAYEETVQDKMLYYMAKKIDAAMTIQGKFSEEGLRAMTDSEVGDLNALGKKLFKDGGFDVQTIYDITKKKNQTFEQLQNSEEENYDSYVMNPIEGGMETIKKIRDGVLDQMRKDVDEGKISKKDLEEMETRFANLLEEIEDLSDFNKGVKKKDRATEGQMVLALEF